METVAWRKKHGPLSTAHDVKAELEDGRYKFYCGRTSPEWDAELVPEGDGHCSRCEKAKEKASKARKRRQGTLYEDARERYEEVPEPENWDESKLCQACHFSVYNGRGLDQAWLCKSGKLSDDGVGCRDRFGVDKTYRDPDGNMHFYRRQ